MKVSLDLEGAVSELILILRSNLMHLKQGLSICLQCEFSENAMKQDPSFIPHCTNVIGDIFLTQPYVDTA